MDQPFNDGISSLAALSGKPLVINEDRLQGFKVAQFGKTIAVMPAKLMNEVVGMLTVMRNENRSFEPEVQIFPGVITDSAGMILMDAGLPHRLREAGDATCDHKVT